jgi:hypothetical protein
MSSWSDQQKWWMDIAKSAILFAMASGVAYLLTDRLHEEQAEASFLRNSNFEGRVSALREFETSSVQYIGAGHNAFIDLYQWQVCAQQTQNMNIFLGSANISRQVAMAKVLRNFKDVPGVAPRIVAFGVASDKFWKVFDLIWDRRLDACGDPTRSDPNRPSPNPVWREASEARAQHEQALKSLREAQEAVSLAAEPALTLQIQ